MQCKIRQFSNLSLHPDHRWDSEYLCFEPYKNRNLNYVPIGNILSFSQYGVSIEMNEEGNGTKIYRMNEINNMFCQRNILKYAELSTDEIALYKLKDRDILFNRTNSQPLVGRTGIFRKFSEEDIVFASYLVRINPDPTIITPECLTAFLNTKYGVLDVQRRARISIGQSNVNAEELKRVEVPLLCDKLQTQITFLFDKAFHLIQAAEAKYRQAETLLLSELGLTDWRPQHRLTFVKNYSDTEQAGRIDADYFQPFYEEVNDKLQSTGFVLAGNICSQINYGTVPTSPYSEDNSGVPYIKGLNLKNLRVDTEKLDYITNTDDLPNRVFTKEGDIIISQMGTVGNCGVVSREQENWVFASFTIRIRIADKSKYDPYFVALYIETIAKPYYLMRNIAQASVRQNTDLPTIKQMPISNLPFEKQQQISQKIIESFNLSKQSKHLLECAKRAVEIAIEQDEQTAIDYIENSTKEMEI